MADIDNNAEVKKLAAQRDSLLAVCEAWLLYRDDPKYPLDIDILTDQTREVIRKVKG
jgi:hypothetical protein